MPATLEVSKPDLDTELARMTIKQLREELFTTLNATMEQVVRLAAIVRALNDKGDDLSDIKLEPVRMLKRIAHGQTLPELFMAFRGSPRLLDRVARLPLVDQRHIVDGKPVRVVVIENGKREVRMLTPYMMSPEEWAQVFDKDHVRDEEEQVGWLRVQTAKTHAKTTVSMAMIDKKRRGIVVGEHFIPHAQLLTLLAQLG